MRQALTVVLASFVFTTSVLAQGIVTGVTYTNTAVAIGGADLAVLNGIEPISQDDRNHERIRSSTVSVNGAPGERVHFSLSVRAERSALIDALLSVSGFTGDVANTDVDLTVLKYWYQGASAPYGIAGPGSQGSGRVLVPELLLHDDDLIRVTEDQNEVYLTNSSSYEVISDYETPDDNQGIAEADFQVDDADTLQSFDVAFGANRQVVGSVQIPASAAPGMYSGQIDIDINSGSATGSIGITIEVLDYTPPELDVAAIFYRSVVSTAAQTPGVINRTQAELITELQNLADHGVNPTSYQTYGTWTTQQESDFIDHMEAREMAGLDSKPLYWLGINTGNYNSSPATLAPVIANIEDAADDFNITDLWFYGADEPGNETVADANDDAMQYIIDTAGYNNFMAISKDVIDFDTGAPNYNDELTLPIIRLYPEEGLATEWRATDHTTSVASYANPQGGPEDPYFMRQNMGILLWANGYDGPFTFAWMWEDGFVWNDWDDETYREHNFVYPEYDGGVIDTLAWEAYSQAIWDYRYIKELEAQIIANPGSLATDAQAYLDSLDVYYESIRSILQLPNQYTAPGIKDLNNIRNAVKGFIAQF